MVPAWQRLVASGTMWLRETGLAMPRVTAMVSVSRCDAFWNSFPEEVLTCVREEGNQEKRSRAEHMEAMELCCGITGTWEAGESRGNAG